MYARFLIAFDKGVRSRFDAVLFPCVLCIPWSINLTLRQVNHGKHGSEGNRLESNECNFVKCQARIEPKYKEQTQRVKQRNTKQYLHSDGTQQ